MTKIKLRKEQEQATINVEIKLECCKCKALTSMFYPMENLLGVSPRLRLFRKFWQYVENVSDKIKCSHCGFPLPICFKEEFIKQYDALRLERHRANFIEDVCITAKMDLTKPSKYLDW